MKKEIEKKQDAGRKRKVKINKVKMLKRKGELKRKKVLERKGARAHVIAQRSPITTAFYYKGFCPVNSSGSQSIAYGIM